MLEQGGVRKKLRDVMGGQPTKARGPRENPQRGKYASKKGKKGGNKGKNKGNKKKWRGNKGRRARRQGEVDCIGNGDSREPTRTKRERWLPRWRSVAHAASKEAG